MRDISLGTKVEKSTQYWRMFASKTWSLGKSIKNTYSRRREDTSQSMRRSKCWKIKPSRYSICYLQVHIRMRRISFSAKRNWEDSVKLTFFMAKLKDSSISWERCQRRSQGYQGVWLGSWSTMTARNLNGLWRRRWYSDLMEKWHKTYIVPVRWWPALMLIRHK